ncbi:MAG: VpsF family polysaccharide biosynthesis protein [Devosia sp.]
MCTAVAIVIRIVISPQMLNLVVDYTSDGGSLLGKLHTGTYAIFVLLPLVLISRPIRLQALEIGKFRGLLRFSAVLIVLTIYLFSVGRAGSSGFLLDTDLSAAAAGLIALALGRESRRALGELVLCVLIASAVLGIIEAALKIHFLPFGVAEEEFRPIGLTSHPLALGALCCLGVGFAPLAPWRLWLRVVAMLVLFLGCAASSARLALMMTVFEILALMLFVPWPRLTPQAERRAKFAALMLTLLLGAALITVLLSAGLLYRFRDSLFDQSFMARIEIYQIFGYVSSSQILFGMGIDSLTALVRDKLGMDFIESTPVFITMVFGVFAASIFMVSMIVILRRLLMGVARPAHIATIIYVIISLSNNAFSTKTPEMLILTVLLLAFVSPYPAKESAGAQPAQTAERTA